MADSLGTSRAVVACACMGLFEWLDSEGRPDDEADLDSDITVTLLSRSERDKRNELLSHIDETSRLPGLGKALLEVGWVHLTETAIVFCRAARHNSETAKKRALAARRKQKQRAARHPEVRHAKSVTREEKRRVYIKPPVVPQTKSWPDGFDTPKVRQSFVDWFSHLERHGKPVLDPDESADRSIRLFTTPADLVASIDFAIANGYVTIKNYSEARRGQENAKPEPKPKPLLKPVR